MAVQFSGDFEDEPPMSLVERLRQWEGEYHYPAGLLAEAADRIEELEQELEQLLKRERRS